MENHTRFTVTALVKAVFHSVMTILTFLILTKSVRCYRAKFLHKKSWRNVLYSCYLNFSIGKAVISQILPVSLKKLKMNSDDSINYK